MDNYLLLKLIHILSAVIVAGTGTGIAFFMLMASRSDNPAVIAVTARHVVLADWIFTAPALMVQLLSGILLQQKLGFSFSSVWFLLVISLFSFVVLCWIPVVFIQYKIKSVAYASLSNSVIDPAFHKWMRMWIALGAPAYTAILTLFWLMVFKPFPVV